MSQVGVGAGRGHEEAGREGRQQTDAVVEHELAEARVLLLGDGLVREELEPQRAARARVEHERFVRVRAAQRVHLRALHHARHLAHLHPSTSRHNLFVHSTTGSALTQLLLLQAD